MNFHNNQQNIRLEPVTIEPVKRTPHLIDGTELYRLAFRIDPEFFKGQIEMRFPEVLQSVAGFHFLDHYRTTLFPLSEPDPFPQWQHDANQTRLSYTHRTSEGLEFGGQAVVGKDEVCLHFFVNNCSSETMYKVEPNMCLEFSQSEDFPPNDLALIHIVTDGCLRDLSGASPVPIRNGETWPLILTKEGVGRFKMPADSPTWTLIEDVADENLMAIQSNDGRYLVGYAWDQMPQTHMSNGRYPCLHTGPGAVEILESGQTHRWQGKVYFVKGADKDQLLHRFRKDTKDWSQSAN
jgi:phage-related protein